MADDGIIDKRIVFQCPAGFGTQVAFFFISFYNGAI